MSSINPTIPVRSGEGLNAAQLLKFIQKHFVDLDGPLTVSQFPSGRSNLTYLLTVSDRKLVLRRPPHGTKAKSAHDMLREFTFLRGLKSQFGALPTVYLHCPDSQIIGSEFILMEAVPGDLIHQSIPDHWGWDATGVRDFCLSFWDRMIELHSLDYHHVELGTYGRPSGYVKRQVEGWSKRYVNAQTPDAPDGSLVIRWLAERMPEDGESAVIHNDYRIDNVILDAQNPMEIKAVLDWEMAAVGNPLMDLGNSLAYWTEAADGEEALRAASQPSATSGMLTRKEVLDHYASRTGQSVTGFDFYYVYGLFRLAGIIQQIYFRYYHGQTSDARFDGWVREVWRLVERCEKIIAGDRSLSLG